MIPQDREELNEQWDGFENVATYRFARSTATIERKTDVYQSKNITNSSVNRIIVW